MHTDKTTSAEHQHQKGIMVKQSVVASIPPGENLIFKRNRDALLYCYWGELA